MSILRFVSICIASAVLLSLIAFLLGESVYPAGAMPFIIGGIGLAAVTTAASYAIVYRGLKIRIQQFTAYIMGGMMIKMFLGIISISVIALKFKDITTHYVLTYFLCYFIFTGFEVVTLMTNLRAEKSEGKRDEKDHSAH